MNDGLDEYFGEAQGAMADRWERTDPGSNGKSHVRLAQHQSVSATSSSTALVAFPLQAFSNIHLQADRRNYLVKGLLTNSGLAVIWGPPKCGKSFWAADLGLHIALGWDYRGHKVQQATVVYVALEGRHGFPARIEAFRRHHGVEAAPFHLLTGSLDLVAQSGQLIAAIKAQLGTGEGWARSRQEGRSVGEYAVGDRGSRLFQFRTFIR
jgi:AAA domain